MKVKADALVRKVKGALVYPSVIVVVASVVTFIMLTYIVPVFAKMFSGVGAALPMPTQMVLNLSNFLRSNILFFFAFLIAAIVGLRFYIKTDKGRLNFDKFLLRVPLIGALIRKSAIARFTRT